MKEYLCFTCACVYRTTKRPFHCPKCFEGESFASTSAMLIGVDGKVLEFHGTYPTQTASVLYSDLPVSSEPVPDTRPSRRKKATVSDDQISLSDELTAVKEKTHAY